MKTTDATDTEPTPKPALSRKPPRKPSKPDAVLAAAVESARAGLLEVAPEEQVGEWLSAVPEADRLVTHRFRANRPGYRGWEWYATVARVPRGKVATVCEVGLLPSADAILAPEWVPWSQRVRPEDVAAEESGAAAETVDGQQTGTAPDAGVKEPDAGTAEAAQTEEDAAAPAAMEDE
ncbi:DUF3027 domain-containing protein [Arthrobacter sp. NPDC055585]